jgi:hypothetical protein
MSERSSRLSAVCASARRGEEMRAPEEMMAVIYRHLMSHPDTGNFLARASRVPRQEDVRLSVTMAIVIAADIYTFILHKQLAHHS